MTTYKTIKRKYYETISDLTPKIGFFIARGQWGDGHLAYSRIDEKGNDIDGEEGRYVQLRGANGLYMLGI